MFLVTCLLCACSGTPYKIMNYIPNEESEEISIAMHTVEITNQVFKLN